MQHDTVTANISQTCRKNATREYCHVLAILMYFSEGAASQHKHHKNFHHLCWHEHDSGLSAEWHFIASS